MAYKYKPTKTFKLCIFIIHILILILHIIIPHRNETCFDLSVLYLVSIKLI